jgi:chromosome segregation ATPase
MLGAFPLLCLLTVGCASSGTAVPPPGTPAAIAASEAATASTSTPARLYARDGSVIGGDAVAEAVSAEASTQNAVADRQLGPSEGGRMYILELYQKAIDERDALELEVRSVQSELELARTAASRAESESSGGAQRIAALEEENRRLLAENVELAARLTTAQIRRLQAEKLLLEARIGELRTGAVPTPTPNETQPVATTSKP